MLRYARFAPRMWRSDVNDAVARLIDAEPGEVLVDIGAGMGPTTVQAAKAGATVIAVEPTPYMRRVLATRLRLVDARSRARVTVVDAGAESIPASDGWVDAVTSVNTMHHWVDVEKGVAEIARVLRPDGRLLLVDEDFADPAHPEHEHVRGSDHHSGDDEHHHGFTMVDAEQMGALFASAGVDDISASKCTLAGRPVIAVSRNVDITDAT